MSVNLNFSCVLIHVDVGTDDLVSVLFVSIASIHDGSVILHLGDQDVVLSLNLIVEFGLQLV